MHQTHEYAEVGNSACKICESVASGFAIGDDWNSGCFDLKPLVVVCRDSSEQIVAANIHARFGDIETLFE